jgi:hypothetical protein
VEVRFLQSNGQNDDKIEITLLDPHSPIHDELFLGRDGREQRAHLAILTFIYETKYPVTPETIARECNHSIELVTQFLEKVVEKSPYLQDRLVFLWDQSQKFFAFEFPAIFPHLCGDCRWFSKNLCSIWKEVGRTFPEMIPKPLKARIHTLRPESTPCMAYQSSKPFISIPFDLYPNYQQRIFRIRRQAKLKSEIERSKMGLTLECLLCNTPLFFADSTTDYCHSCHTSYYRVQKNGKEFITACFNFEKLFDHQIGQIMSAKFDEWWDDW